MSAPSPTPVSTGLISSSKTSNAANPNSLDRKEGDDSLDLRAFSPGGVAPRVINYSSATRAENDLFGDSEGALADELKQLRRKVDGLTRPSNIELTQSQFRTLIGALDSGSRGYGSSPIKRVTVPAETQLIDDIRAGRLKVISTPTFSFWWKIEGLLAALCIASAAALKYTHFGALLLPTYALLPEILAAVGAVLVLLFLLYCFQLVCKQREVRSFDLLGKLQAVNDGADSMYEMRPLSQSLVEGHIVEEPL